MKKEENFLNLRAGKGKTCGYEARDKSVEAGDYQDIKEIRAWPWEVVEFAGDIEAWRTWTKTRQKMTSRRRRWWDIWCYSWGNHGRVCRQIQHLNFKAIFDECFICCKNYYLTVEKI